MFRLIDAQIMSSQKMSLELKSGTAPCEKGKGIQVHISAYSNIEHSASGCTIDIEDTLNTLFHAVSVYLFRHSFYFFNLNPIEHIGPELNNHTVILADGHRWFRPTG